MYKNNVVKLGLLSLSAGLLLAACNGDETVDTTPVDEGTEEVDETDETTVDENGTDETGMDEDSTETDGEPEEDTTTDDETETDTTDDTSSETDETADSPGIEDVEFEVSLFDAIDLFYDTFGSEDINIDEIEFDRDGNRYYYEIEGWDGEYEYDLDIDAETGDILEQEMELDSDTDDILDLDGIITPQEAMSIAIEAAGDGYAEEWELEEEDGRTVYEIDLVGARDHEVDAHSGDVWPD